MYRKIVVGVDGSEASLKAAEKAADLARASGAELVLVSVVPPPTVLLGELMTPEVVDLKPLIEAARTALEELAGKLSREGKPEISTRVVVGDPGESIVEVAGEEGADLIVVGRRGLSRIERLFLGSVTKKVLERSHIDVLVVVG